MSERPKRESRSDRELREARKNFCAYRHDPDQLLRWMTWYRYRDLLEGWSATEAFERFAAIELLTEAARWKGGWRPPTSFGQAAAIVRRRRREGRLRASGTGL